MIIAKKGMYLGERMNTEAIISFKTDKNGIFSPSIMPISGVLMWEVDGVRQESNMPSFSLSGSVVDVNVYANGVLELETATEIELEDSNIIGDVDLSYFTIGSAVRFSNNPDLTDIKFSTQTNLISSISGSDTGIQSLDLTNCLINGGFTFTNVGSLISVAFSNLGNSLNGFILQDSIINTLDLTLAAINGSITISNNNALNSFIFYGLNKISNILNITSNNTLQSIDLRGSTLSGTVNVNTMPSLSNLEISDTAITVSNLRINDNNLSSINLSNITITSILNLYNNPLSNIVLSGSNNVRFLQSYNCPNLNSVDISNTEVRLQLRFDNCITLSDIDYGDITTGISLINFSNCALPVTKVDELFSDLNTFFSNNTPTKDITCIIDGGTNASPSGGMANADIQNLITLYLNAGYIFNYQIN